MFITHGRLNFNQIEMFFHLRIAKKCFSIKERQRKKFSLKKIKTFDLKKNKSINFNLPFLIKRNEKTSNQSFYNSFQTKTIKQ